MAVDGNERRTRLNAVAGRENQFLKWLKDHVAADGPGVVLGIGDDAAVLEVPAGKQLVTCTDTLVQGVHFPQSTADYAVGHKALAVNLSDLAAMGAVPAWAQLAITLPDGNTTQFKEVLSGFLALAGRYRVSLVGGDISRGPLSLTVQAMGWVDQDTGLNRAGARAGDRIWVTGELGSAAAALQQIIQNRPVDSELRRHLDLPEPPIAFGQRLTYLAHCAIDLSDGLLADLGRMMSASGTGAEIDLDRLPCHPQVQRMDSKRRWKLQLAGGDDYQLCFCAASDKAGEIAAEARRLNIRVSDIGAVTEGSGVIEEGVRCRQPDGGTFEPDDLGYDHFPDDRDE